MKYIRKEAYEGLVPNILHFAELTRFVCDHDFDVIAISETWLEENITDSEKYTRWILLF